MQFATDCRARALVWLEIANQSTEFKDQSFQMAQCWLALALMEDVLNQPLDDEPKSRI